MQNPKSNAMTSPTLISSEPITNLSNPQSEQLTTHNVVTHNPLQPYLQNNHKTRRSQKNKIKNKQTNKNKKTTIELANPPPWRPNHLHKERE